VFADEWVAGHALVCGIGSHTLDAAEIPPATVARAELVLVDTREGTLATAGDIRGPLDEGLLRGDAITELGEAAAAGVKREFAAPAVFKSVGFAALDVAAAKAVTDAALRIGAGTWVALH
jgi:ornithine cyclodeaminase/alanine dehydrogenase-like protein (mu-crystallin family)